MCDNLKCVAYQTDSEILNATQHCMSLKGVDARPCILVCYASLTIGDFPLFMHPPLDELTVEVVAPQPDTCYLALSHVWAVAEPTFTFFSPNLARIKALLIFQPR